MSGTLEATEGGAGTRQLAFFIDYNAVVTYNTVIRLSSFRGVREGAKMPLTFCTSTAYYGLTRDRKIMALDH